MSGLLLGIPIATGAAIAGVLSRLIIYDYGCKLLSLGFFSTTFISATALGIGAPLIVCMGIGVAVMGIALVSITLIDGILSNDMAGSWADLGKLFLATEITGSLSIH